MPIVKNPNSAAPLANRVDRQSESDIAYVDMEVQDLAVDDLELIVTEDAYNWKTTEVALSFNNANARDFTISKLAGVRIVSNINDHFWLKHSSFGPAKRIIIASGFYTTAATFSAAIKTALDSQTDFNNAGITFGVARNPATGRITITPSAGTVQFIYNTGTTVPVANPVRNISLAGKAMGFNADSADAASITGDTGIDIETEYDYVSESGNTALSYVVTDEYPMDMDSALKITATSTNAVVVTARVIHEVERSIR